MLDGHILFDDLHNFCDDGDVLFYNLHNFFDDGDALLDNLLYFSCAWWTINSTCWFRRFVSHVFSGNN
jgi:hypothetical protein